jgi:hypothetical protein
MVELQADPVKISAFFNELEMNDNASDLELVRLFHLKSNSATLIFLSPAIHEITSIRGRQSLHLIHHMLCLCSHLAA